MNNNILKKCLEELNKKDFRKDYVIGMIETLVDVSTGQPTPMFPYQIPQQINSTPFPIPDMSTNFPVINNDPVSDETSQLANSYARGPVAIS